MRRKVKRMLIGEAATRSGVPAKTLRNCQDIGLIEAPARSGSGYRDYDETVLDRLGFIRAAQALGLSLGEIRRIAAMRDGGQISCRHVLGLLRDRSEDIRASIRELRALQLELDRLVERACGLDPADCDPHRVCHLIGPS